MKKQQIFDISLELSGDTLLYPGDPAWHSLPHKAISAGDSCNVSKISLGSHTATHVDSPLHFIPDGKGLSELPLEPYIGKARVLYFPGCSEISRELLLDKDISEGGRILFKTRSSEFWQEKQFRQDYVGIAPDAAEYLVAKKVALIGVDYLSVESYKRPGAPTHKILLGAGIAVLEGLNLSAVEEGEYELIALPLKIKNGDGSPVRAILIK